MTRSDGKTFARRLTKLRNEYLSSKIDENSIKIERYCNRELLNLYLRKIKKRNNRGGGIGKSFMQNA